MRSTPSALISRISGSSHMHIRAADGAKPASTYAAREGASWVSRSSAVRDKTRVRLATAGCTWGSKSQVARDQQHSNSNPCPQPQPCMSTLKSAPHPPPAPHPLAPPGERHAPGCAGSGLASAAGPGAVCAHTGLPGPCTCKHRKSCVGTWLEACAGQQNGNESVQGLGGIGCMHRAGQRGLAEAEALAWAHERVPALMTGFRAAHAGCPPTTDSPAQALKKTNRTHLCTSPGSPTGRSSIMRAMSLLLCCVALKDLDCCRVLPRGGRPGGTPGPCWRAHMRSTASAMNSRDSARDARATWRALPPPAPDSSCAASTTEAAPITMIRQKAQAVKASARKAGPV